MDQVTIDLMAELDKFGGHITQIRDAIQSKGVSSKGKLFNFAEEINSIETASTYAYVLSAVKNAKSKGYLDNEIVKILNELADKNKPSNPKPDTPASEVTEYTGTEIPSMKFITRHDLKGELIGREVIKVGNLAFNFCGYTIVRLPKATNINSGAFNLSNIKVLEIPSFVWKNNNLNLQSESGKTYGPVEIIVADESVPPSDIPDSLKVYSSDKTKVWSTSTKKWVNI